MSRWVSSLLIAGVRFYQMCLRPLISVPCIYTPSCSEYFIGSVRKHGPVLGGARGAWRLCRCHPFASGGYDPP